MERIGHVQIDENLELSGFRKFVWDDRDRMLGNANKVVDTAVIATETFIRGRCLGGDH